MKKNSNKEILKNIGLVLLIIAVLGFLFGIFSKQKADDDGRVEVKLSYEIGGLTEYGKYDEADDKLYSEMFECKGLNVGLDFDANVEFEIYFYDEDEHFVSKIDKTSDSFKGDIPETASFARIVIYPTFEKGDEQKVNLLNKYSFIKQLTVKVYEDQSNDTEETE